MLKIATIVVAGVIFALPAMAQNGNGQTPNGTEKSSTDKGMTTDKGMKSGTATTGMAAPKPMSSDTKKETDQKNASPASMDTGVKKEK
jgi:hypothetical protein